MGNTQSTAYATFRVLKPSNLAKQIKTYVAIKLFDCKLFTPTKNSSPTHVICDAVWTKNKQFPNQPPDQEWELLLLAYDKVYSNLLTWSS